MGVAQKKKRRYAGNVYLDCRTPGGSTSATYLLYMHLLTVQVRYCTMLWCFLFTLPYSITSTTRGLCVDRSTAVLSVSARFRQLVSLSATDSLSAFFAFLPYYAVCFAVLQSFSVMAVLLLYFTVLLCAFPCISYARRNTVFAAGPGLHG